MNRLSFVISIFLSITLYACDQATNGIPYINPYDVKGMTYTHFTAGRQWTKTPENALWNPRCYHTSVVFNEKLWIIGGNAHDGVIYDLTNDVWFSSNGETWEVAAQTASWTIRMGHTSVLLSEKMWVIGGNSGDNDNKVLNDDVWSSLDGANWDSVAVAPGSWTARWAHSSVTFDNKIWILGGEDETSYRNDVWSSPDGATWSLVTESAEWPPRRWHSSVVFDSKIWIIGGEVSEELYENDAWSSSDGITWTRVTESAEWSPRRWHKSIVYRDMIMIIGGHDGSFKRDVWYSSNGSSFIKNTGSAGWSARVCHSSVVFNDKIWIIGGYDGLENPVGAKNDVWYSE